jgi:hypothetical protein
VLVALIRALIQRGDHQDPAMSWLNQELRTSAILQVLANGTAYKSFFLEMAWPGNSEQNYWLIGVSSNTKNSK